MQSVSVKHVWTQAVLAPLQLYVPQAVWVGAGQLPLAQPERPVAVQMLLAQVQEAVTQAAVG